MKCGGIFSAGSSVSSSGPSIHVRLNEVSFVWHSFNVVQSGLSRILTGTLELQWHSLNTVLEYCCVVWLSFLSELGVCAVLGALHSQAGSCCDSMFSNRIRYSFFYEHDSAWLHFDASEGSRFLRLQLVIVGFCYSVCFARFSSQWRFDKKHSSVGYKLWFDVNSGIVVPFYCAPRPSLQLWLSLRRYRGFLMMEL